MCSISKESSKNLILTSQWEDDYYDNVELRYKGNFSRFFQNNYELEKYISHNLYYKLPLLEAAIGENHSFDSYLSLYEKSNLSNFALFAKNTNELQETELLLKNEMQSFDNDIYKNITYSIEPKQKKF